MQLSKKQRPIWRKTSTKNLSQCTCRFLGLQSLKKKGTSGTSRRTLFLWPSLYAKDSHPIMSAWNPNDLYFWRSISNAFFQVKHVSFGFQEVLYFYSNLFFHFLKLMGVFWFLLWTTSEHLSQPFGGWVLGKVHWCYQIHNAPSMKGLRVQIQCI